MRCNDAAPGARQNGRVAVWRITLTLIRPARLRRCWIG